MVDDCDFDIASGCGCEGTYATKAETKMEGARIDAFSMNEEYSSRWNLRSNNADKSRSAPAVVREEKSFMVALMYFVFRNGKQMRTSTDLVACYSELRVFRNRGKCAGVLRVNHNSCQCFRSFFSSAISRCLICCLMH